MRRSIGSKEISKKGRKLTNKFVGLNIRNRIPRLGQESIFFEAGENGVLLDTEPFDKLRTG